MKKLSSLVRTTLLRSPLVMGICVSSCVLALGCNGDTRIPQGGQFSSLATGNPGIVLIDDMEDGDQYVLSDDGLNGLWYIYNDESAGSIQTPDVGFPMTPNNGNTAPMRFCGDPQGVVFAGETDCNFIVHTSGSGQLGWGAGIGVDLNGDGGEKNSVDATAYAGIGFFARGSAPPTNVLSVKIQDVSTTPESASAAADLGIAHCQDPLSNPSELPCADHFLYNITLTDEWRWYAIPWSTFASFSAYLPYGFRDGTYNPNGFLNPGLHLDALVGLQFQVAGADPDDDGIVAEGVLAQPFEFSIDNVGFIEAFQPTLGATLISTADY